jgi:hypothetical protein
MRPKHEDTEVDSEALALASQTSWSMTSSIWLGQRLMSHVCGSGCARANL